MAKSVHFSVGMITKISVGQSSNFNQKKFDQQHGGRARGRGEQQQMEAE
jgi:hypothetical protein